MRTSNSAPLAALPGRVLNGAGEPCPAGGLLEWTGLEASNRLLSGIKPVITGGTRFVIALETIPAGVDGECLGDLGAQAVVTVAVKAGETVIAGQTRVGACAGSFFAQVDPLGPMRVEKLISASGVGPANVECLITITGEAGDYLYIVNDDGTVQGPARHVKIGRGYSIASANGVVTASAVEEE